MARNDPEESTHDIAPVANGHAVNIRFTYRVTRESDAIKALEITI